MTAAGQRRGLQTAKGRRRSSTPKSQPVSSAGRFDARRFRVQIRRPRDGKVELATLAIDSLVTEVTWERSGSTTTGSIGFHEPDGRDVPGIIAKGDIVRLLAQNVPGGAWLLVWELTAGKPTRSLATRSWTADLTSKLSVAQKTRKAWRYVKDRQHRQGWRADEVVVAAARRMGVPLGRIARGRVRHARIATKSGGVLDVATKAYAAERKQTGRRFDVSIARGVLDVTELRRPSYMLPIGRFVTDATLGEGIAEKFASAVVVTSVRKAKKGKKRSKIKVTVVDRARVRRYGYIEKRVTEPNLSSVAAARRFGKRWLARVASPYKEIEVTHPGIPWVQRGDAFDLTLRAASLRQTVWVKSASHTLSPGSYTMTLTLATDDPWLADEKKARVAKKKAAVARARKRRANEVAKRRLTTAKNGRRR